MPFSAIRLIGAIAVIVCMSPAAYAQRTQTDIDALLALAGKQRDARQWTACADTYGKVVAFIEKPERNQWSVFFLRGVCLERSKQWDKADAHLRQALALNPDNPMVLNMLGFMLVDRGIHFEEGVRMIERAIVLRPNDGFVMDSVGWVQYLRGNYGAALVQLLWAVGLQPNDPTLRDHLGDTYWKLNRREEAKDEWSRALKFNPEPEHLAKLEAKIRNGMPD